MQYASRALASMLILLESRIREAVSTRRVRTALTKEQWKSVFKTTTRVIDARSYTLVDFWDDAIVSIQAG